MIKLILKESEAMKNISNILKFAAFAAIVSVAFSCTREEIEAPAPSGEKFTLEVSLEPQLKTTLGASDGSGERKVYWSNGDQIAVNGSASEALENLPDNTQSTIFTFSDVLSTPYNVLYPASAFVDASHITLPAVQTYKAGSFADGMSPMAGISTDGSSLTLSHLCAVLHISIKRSSAVDADTDNIIAVRFKGKNSEQVCGSFGIDYSAATLSSNSSADADKEVRVVKSQETSTTDAIEYFLVVPAGTYSSGFEVTIQDVNGDIMKKSKTSSCDLVAGKLYNMTEVIFVPTGVETGIEIDSAEDLIAFATAYNNKEYSGFGSSLRATVTDDITFDTTSSADFNATGGIGTKYGGDNYFNGLFNGDNHTISGLDATVPLFGGIGDNGVVKNLTLNSSCSFTFTHDKSAEGMFASIVGYHKGILDNVKVAADINLAAVTGVKKMTTVGGLAGRITVGKLQNGCEYSGLISTPAGFTTSSKLIIGGLVGRFTNAGSVTDSYFKGAISNAAQVTSTDTENPYLIIGGVVGHVGGNGSVSSTNTTSDHEAVATAHSSMTGIIVNKTTIAYHSAVGGIVGELAEGTVSSCSNAANIALTIFKGSASDTDDMKAGYMKTGGIVGKVDSDGIVTSCTNNGKVEHRSNPRRQDIGGIAGYNAGSITGCTNNGAVNHMTTGVSGSTKKGGRNVNIAGVIGENVSGATVSDVHNTADIQISAIEDNYDSDNDQPVCEIRMGGVIAYNQEEIDGGSTKNITNSGKVNLTTTPQNPFIGFELGGIVGYSTAPVKNVLNSGQVVNTLGNAYVVSRLYMGGIVGELSNSSNATISGCENSGEVYFNINGKAAAHTGDYVGGIIGYADGAATATVSDCENSGYVHVNCNISTAVSNIVVGGVIGKMAEDGSVTECSNTASSGTAGQVEIGGMTGAVAHTDLFVGGVLGYSANAVALSDCDNSGYINGGSGTKQNGSTFFMGGIVAYLAGASSISNCDNTGRVWNNHSNNNDTATLSVYTGGVAGYVIGSASDHITIEDCDNTAQTGGRRGYVAGTVGYSEYAEITNCTFNQSILASQSYNRWLGGIVGWAVDSNITDCTFSGTELSASSLQANGGGGIASKLNNCTVDGCNSYVTSIGTSDGGNNVTGGAIVGISGSGNTIQNCHYKATINGVAANIAGTGSFTGSNNVANL